GTVMMVLLMSMIVVPFGVVAALYLREYAKQGPLVRVVRIAVNNLAGVPSIVFGVFGLWFFIYLIGGTVDRLFYAEALPSPTYGTGGILWASLTLALMTVPVVIVATEESLAAIPREWREGSLALGAAKWETLRKIVIPGALPGILTGMILAMARGAGEVAPLLLTRVVKMALTRPTDGHQPEHGNGQEPSSLQPAEVLEIQIHDLCLDYGGKQALQHINMDIARGQVTAFIGPSGCGKSTLLRCLNRLNDLVDGVTITGSIRIGGTDIYGPGLDVTDLRKRVGIVFQKSNPFPKSIFENVDYGPRILGVRSEE